MTSIRPTAVAGSFYPSDAHKLRAQVRELLKNAHTDLPAPKALIAPHAGYVYSGPIAASAYATIKNARGTIRRVVLLGPAHRVPLRGLALSSADFFESPLGKVPLDHEAMEKIKHLPGVQVSDAAHANEHSLEVHLPFLQETLEAFTLVPLVVGEVEASTVARVLDALWGGPETLIVVSSDLSHYHDYATAQRLDRTTSQAIEQGRPQDIDVDRACGRYPVNGLLTVAKARGLNTKTLDLRNSGDTAGPRDRVVGYGAYVFH